MMNNKLNQEINSLIQIKHWRESHARKVLAIWAQSNTSLLGFCRKFNIGYQRLLRWRNSLERINNKFDFVQISLTQQQELDTSMEITFQNGRGIRIYPGFEPRALQQLIHIIEE